MNINNFLIKNVKIPKMYQGLDGNIGPTGNQGPDGTLGVTGPRGNIGTSGIIGVQGNVGNTGNIGNIGPIGISGNIGPIGISGDFGLDGLIGEIGPDGEIGIIGDIGSIGNNGDIGNIGEQGNPGLNGLSGEAVIEHGMLISNVDINTGFLIVPTGAKFLHLTMIGGGAGGNSGGFDQLVGQMYGGGGGGSGMVMTIMLDVSTQVSCAYTIGRGGLGGPNQAIPNTPPSGSMSGEPTTITVGLQTYYSYGGHSPNGQIGGLGFSSGKNGLLANSLGFDGTGGNGGGIIDNGYGLGGGTIMSLNGTDATTFGAGGGGGAYNAEIYSGAGGRGADGVIIFTFFK